MDKEQQKQPLVIEYRKNYGTSASSQQPFAPAASQPAGTSEQQPLLPQQRSIIYCVHGQLANSCCELPNELSIRKIDSHCHKPRAEGIDKIARKKLMLASMLCIIFMIAEIIGGIYSNSLAIATDAAHLMADLASFMISLFALWIAARPSTKRLSFGWYRAEVIGALLSVLMIWVVTAILFYLAVLRTINKDFELNGEVMLVTSGLGILVNIIMGATLHHHGHSHGGGGGHHEEQNINVRAAFVHVLSDFVQSLGVFIAALVIYFKPEWNIIDPICTFLFSVLVLGTTLAIMRDAIVVLMEGTPKYLDYTEVMQTFLQIEGVVRVHNLRIWALSINKIALAAHLAVEPSTNTELVLNKATETVHAKYQFFETTLQIEVFQPDMEDCNQCSNPV
ncbi:zinc transporter 2 [Anopheles arabiensis]|uniref:Cation efflux protein cytoplasmic domain-containing protein n=1 Tax=Anopheles arabiensis TaxID=7173 RepID=A0A182I7L7_ANOAR|nr:zinc transporter 2 [Anopheles arabiensis]XP_040165488.1 zinc transporter 2 [Anopheles arabiensis]XP_040165490.1 zinc transporter 2 [Anopheles arabiensis]XP_040165491.1 zinc transporter 2 [Anopheles arabiensis]